jgi:2-aminoethylphosphonate-pyruvate transaminase
MQRDLGSRDVEFVEIVREIRQRLLALTGASERTHTAVLMQGSGTFGLESVISSVIPPDGKLLVVENGAYGRRMRKIADVLRVPASSLVIAENRLATADVVCRRLESDGTITHVAVVHCETTSGIVNPVGDIGAVVRGRHLCFIVDAMSSFGAIPLDLTEAGIDILVSSANKCIEGVPGFSFVLASKQALPVGAGFARSLSLDLIAQLERLERDGQFRFTPPTHALLAFRQALLELEQEGGVAGRADRYKANHDALIVGMREMGFREYLSPEDQGYIITSFRYPADPAFDFERFYGLLNERGYVIYPGRLGEADCFRIGTIGRITVGDVRGLLAAIRETLGDMAIRTPLADANGPQLGRAARQRHAGRQTC